MITFPRSYQAYMFGDMSSIKLEPDVISKLFGVLSDRGLLPSTLHEISFRQDVPNTTSQAGIQLRPRFVTPNEEWSISFESTRIRVAKEATGPQGANVGTPEQFIMDAIEYFNSILSAYPIKGNRLSLVTDIFMDDMPTWQLDQIYTKLFKPLGFYQSSKPVEWNTRTVSHKVMNINGNDEMLNTIAQIARVQGTYQYEFNTLMFDRINVVIDINTHQGNTDTRYNIDAIRDYMPKVLGVREEILDSIEVMINE